MLRGSKGEVHPVFIRFLIFWIRFFGNIFTLNPYSSPVFARDIFTCKSLKEKCGKDKKSAIDWKENIQNFERIQ